MLRKLAVYIIGTGLLTSFAKIACVVSVRVLNMVQTETIVPIDGHGLVCRLAEQRSLRCDLFLHLQASVRFIILTLTSCHSDNVLVYFNALLATLNTRKRLRGEAKSSSSNEYQMYCITDMQAAPRLTHVASSHTAGKALRSLTGANLK